MTNVAFILNSNKIYLYIYKCIEAVQENFENIKIDLIFDKNIVPIELCFNKLINNVDVRFSNFKQNPFEIKDINELSFKNIEVKSSLNSFKKYDWIILEKKIFDFDKLNIDSNNNFISLDLDYDLLKKQVLNGNDISLNILSMKKDSENWSNNYQILHAEKGFKNSVFKILFNYNIYLIKFLNKTSIKNVFEKIDKPNFIEELVYYRNLSFRIFLRKFFNKKLNWKIAIQKNNQTFLIKQPENTFWADPFLVKSNNELFLFFEELKSNNVGCISCLVLDKNLEIKVKNIIIDEDHHLSFPNVFIENGIYYMIPESSANNNLNIYECINFPFKWQFHSQLISNIRLIDPVMIFHENRYWIFGNKVADFENDNNEKLFLYYSDELFSGNWSAHIQNPIITDINLARNAGKIYLEDSKLFRVSQNCSNQYGQNIVINEILNLSITDYKEVKIKEINCPKNFKGMHTLNVLDDISVVDFLSNN
jgi:hypothetical protein